MTTTLAERGKERISAAEAIERVKTLVKNRYKDDKADSDRALAEARNFAGGQVERIDKDVIEQGRKWATRLALISRATASGSGAGYYQTSKPNAALVPIVKKIFGILGELEAVVATDSELPLFSPVHERDYYGERYGPDHDIRKLNVGHITKAGDPGETIDHDAIVDMISESVGESVGEAVTELLAQFEIEPIVIPEEPEKPRRNGRSKSS